jgi:valyl-tRNA synthetase
MSPNVPDKPSLDGLEAKWGARWEADGTYRFDRTKPRAEVYAIDTPPPTVSGSLHIGHIFSYTHTDLIARYRRMRGMDVFYPMGFDDNGLATERRVQNYFGVRCDPALPYDPDFSPPDEPPDPPVPVSRPNFIELCQRLTVDDERVFEDLWRFLGLSVDWSMGYVTIGERAQRAAQRSFLRSLARGEAYQAEAPTLWDVDFATPVAQAELEDREVPGASYRLRFPRSGGPPVEIETTRPELVPACVALVAHPDDARYRDLLGTDVVSPLFGVRVPVVAHELADPEKGSGVAMICTFGDVTDVVWWRELGLPVRAVVGRDGRLQPVAWGTPGWESDDPEAARRAYRELEGLPVKRARSRIVELLAGAGDLVGEPKPVTHAVKYYERGERPLEIVTSRQWFIATLDLRSDLLARGKELRWHPPYMEARFESWVEGLNSDWNISRQRFFGVPFPVWYPVDGDGRPDFSRHLLAEESRLPVDPSTDAPTGYGPEQRGRPGGFIGDPDIMDTWATSSLTPQIAGGWEDDPDLFARVFPMDLRPQAHDIIRTWLFSTIVRSDLEHDSLPWFDAAISGFVLDPERKKMSKSKGNVVTPLPLLEEHGADAVRYWAANGRPGADTAVDHGQMRVGRRLAIKILNASRFVISRLEAGLGGAEASDGMVTDALDASFLARLAGVVEEATAAFEGYDYSRALERTEALFWTFCDDHLELVKGRAYGGSAEEGARSARAGLSLALSTQLRLFAPFVPFVAEEVWGWWRDGSIHRAPWPDAADLRRAAGDDADLLVLEVSAHVLSQVRRAKTERRLSMRAPVQQVVVRDTPERAAALGRAWGDLRDAGRIEALDISAGEPPTVLVELAPAAPNG